MLFRKRQPRTTVASANQVAFFQFGIQNALDWGLHLGAPGCRFRQGDESPLQRCGQVATYRVGIDAVFDFDDGAVKHIEQEVVARSRFLGHRLANSEVLAAGNVAEKVRLPIGARPEELSRFTLQTAEHFGQRHLHCPAGVAELGRGQAAVAGLFQVAELLQVLLQPEITLELAEKTIERAIERTGRAQRLAKQVKARVDQGLLLGNGGSRVVIGARVGDAAPENILVLVNDHRLGGGRSEVNADKATHDRFPSSQLRTELARLASLRSVPQGLMIQCTPVSAARLALIIWK